MRDRLDVLFVTPPSRLEVYQGLSDEFSAIEPPVWSGLTAEFLRRHGYSVAILDAEADALDHAGTAARIAEVDPRLAVFSIYGQQPSASTQCMPGAGKTCRLLDDQSDVPTLAFGTHPSALPKLTLETEPYTYICQGEGPYTILGLLEVLNGERDADQVPGLWYRDNDGDIRSTSPAPNIRDLDAELPRQAWDLLDMSRYRAHNWHCLHDLDSRARYASIQTSLGCPYKCSFCCINTPFGGNGIRFWSPENIVAQIDELVTEHGIRNIKIPDEMFVLNKRHVLGICDLLIERDYGLNIWAYARIDTVKDEFLEKLQRAGFDWLALGIESASDFVRDGVTKGEFGVDDIKATVRRIQDNGINVLGNYIFGLPDDTEASMQATLDLALDINAEWANFYSAMAYPGSQLYAMAKETGWPLPNDRNGPGWIGYSQHAYDSLPLPTRHLTAQQVLAFRDHAFDAYFSDARYVSMIEKKFGPPAVEHLARMTAHTLPRRHHDTAERMPAKAG